VAILFLIDKSLAKPNVSKTKTIRFTELLDEQLTVLAKGEGISFNELVLRCCEYALKDYGGAVELKGQGETDND